MSNIIMPRINIPWKHEYFTYIHDGLDVPPMEEWIHHEQELVTVETKRLKELLGDDWLNLIKEE